jgi:hypothetical protein
MVWQGNPGSDYYLELAKGRVEGHSLLHKFSHADALGTTLIDLWSANIAYPWLTAASILKVSSTDATDTSAGAGARTVEIFGLDSDYKEINETVNLNGQTSVDTTEEYLRIYRVIVRSSGTFDSANAGEIWVGTGTVTAGVPAVKLSHVEVGKGQSQMSQYTIPAGKTAYLVTSVITTNGDKEVEFQYYVRPLNEVFQVKFENHLYRDSLPANYKVPHLMIAEKSDITIKAKVGSGTGAVSYEYDLVLVDN